MMALTIRSAQARGHADHGWLESYHSFSFANYHDPKHMNFGPLRVINEDRVQAGKGFGMHGHRDMEIISYVLAGSLEHKDSMGNGSVIKRGDIQIMSAGTGVRHSEYNPSLSDPVHFVQIWLLPDREGHAPRYDQKHFSDQDKSGSLRLIASQDGRDGSGKIHQDASLYATLLKAQETIDYNVQPDRKIWIQVLAGALSVNGHNLQPGDGLASENETALHIASAQDNTEILFFDLPPSP
jgi:quercetin 2,3-dioxygenase